MHDALDPIRQAYGEARPDGTEPEPGEAAHTEVELLRTTMEALAYLPAQRPDRALLDAVEQAAADAVAPFGPLRHAYGEASGSAPAEGDDGYAEYQLLASTRIVLEQASSLVGGTAAPSGEVLQAIEEAAKHQALIPVRAAYDEGRSAPVWNAR